MRLEKRYMNARIQLTDEVLYASKLAPATIEVLAQRRLIERLRAELAKEQIELRDDLGDLVYASERQPDTCTTIIEITWSPDPDRGVICIGGPHDGAIIQLKRDHDRPGAYPPHEIALTFEQPSSETFDIFEQQLAANTMTLPATTAVANYTWVGVDADTSQHVYLHTN